MNQQPQYNELPLNNRDVNASADINGTDYQNLFRTITLRNLSLRGLSTFELDSTIDNSSEKNVTDLSELVLSGQVNHSDKSGIKMEHDQKTLSTMSNVCFEAAPAPSSIMIVNQIQNVSSIRNEQPMIAKLNLPVQQANTTPQMSTRRINLKRLSNSSSNTTLSSSMMSPENSNASGNSVRHTGKADQPQPSKRGRKPNSQTGAHLTQEKARLIKKTLADSEVADKPLVYFGNKVVPKNTEEYYKRRENNNVAVKKCREKSNQKQSEREHRMKALEDENKRLSDIVDRQLKELSVLKNILIQTNPLKKLPEEIELMLKNFDN
jgi:hypothetical protein